MMCYLLMLCTFFKGLFLNSCTFFKGLFALFCHFFKGLSVAKIQNFLLKGKENGNYFLLKGKVFPFTPIITLMQGSLQEIISALNEMGVARIQIEKGKIMVL